MNLVTSASDRASAPADPEDPPKSLFGTSEDDSILGKDAAGTIDTIMASAAIKESLSNNSDKLEGAFFGTQSGQGGEGEEGGEGGEGETGGQAPAQGMLSEDEETQLKDALLDYYKPDNYTDEETRQDDKDALINIGKLFGFDSDYLNEELTKKETQNP